MMDQIKTALEAAVDVSLTHDGEDVSPLPLHIRNHRRWRVAHELATFVRVLPENWRDYTKKELAAAVERAAREGTS